MAKPIRSSPIKPRGAAYYVDRIRRKVRTVPGSVPRQVFRYYLEKARKDRASNNRQDLIALTKYGNWETRRGIGLYNETLSSLKSFFKNNSIHGIEDIASSIPRGKNSVLRVLDDGAGDGRFLEELKQKMLSKNIPTNTVALSLTKNPKLLEQKRQKTVDEVFVGLAEKWVPEKPFDLIVSFFGSINYAIPGLQKDHLLKFAHSLKKGGVMIARLDLPEPIQRKAIAGIEKSFEKRGFKARFYYIGEEAYDLIVQRIR